MRWTSAENQWLRQQTDTEVALQLEEEQRREAAKARVRLWGSVVPRIESQSDRDRRGREEGVR